MYVSKWVSNSFIYLPMSQDDYGEIMGRKENALSIYKGILWKLQGPIILISRQRENKM